MKKNVYNKISIVICLVCFLLLVATPMVFAQEDLELPAPDIIGQEDTQASNTSPSPADSALNINPPQNSPSNDGSWLILALGGVLLVLAAGVVYFIIKRNQKS